MTFEPMQPFPDGPREVDPRDPLQTVGVEIVATVVTRARDGAKVPSLMWQFIQPSGTRIPAIVLPVDDRMITSLVALIASAGEIAMAAAEAERKAAGS